MHERDAEERERHAGEQPRARLPGGEVEHGPLIDHIASDLVCTDLRTWAGMDAAGKLSDHAGVACTLHVTE